MPELVGQRQDSARLLEYELTLLGGFALSINGRPVNTVTAPRLQALLGYLVLNAHRQLDRAWLASLFWPELSDETARSHLRKTLFKLRECLPANDEPLVQSKTSIQWIGVTHCDVPELEALLAGPQTLEIVLRIRDRYTGPLLPGCTDSWCTQMRERLEVRVLSTLDATSTQLESSHQYATALALVGARLKLQPVHEESWFRLFRLHRALGDHAAALNAYGECRSILTRALKVEPGSAFTRAAEQLTPAPAGIATISLGLPLIGRGTEYEQLLGAWGRVQERGALLAVLSGAAGIGKTRLAEELAQHLTRQGLKISGTGCTQSDQQSAFSALAVLLRGLPQPQGPVSLLAEVGRLLPEVLEQHPGLPPVLSLTEPGQRQRFFMAISRHLQECEPVLLVIDDLQWCDEATLEFLLYFLRLHSTRKVMWLATLRTDEDFAPGILTGELLPALRRQQRMLEIGLGPLTQQEAFALLRAEAKEALPAHLLEGLNAEAEGTPLYLLELLRARHLHGEASLRAGQYPQTLTEAIALRTSVLGQGTRQILEMMSVLDGPAAPEMLAEASTQSELEVIEELEELVRRQLVLERSDATFRFAHGLVGAIVYQLLSLARRRVLHRRMGEALERRVDATHATALQVATQYEKAGVPEKAASFFLQAGARAARLGDLLEARRSLKKGLAVQELPVASRLGGLEQLLQVATLLSALEVGLQAAEELAALAQSSGDERARVLALIHRAHLLQGLGRPNEAEAPLAEALSCMHMTPGDASRPLSSIDASTRLQAHIQMAELSMRRLRLESIWHDCTLAQGYYHELAPACQEPGIHISGGMALLWLGKRKEAHGAVEAALKLAVRQERREWEGVARYWVASIILHEGRQAEAEDQLRKAISLAERVGCTGHIPIFTLSLSGLLALQGRMREALTLLGLDPGTPISQQRPAGRYAAEAGYLLSFLGLYSQASELVRVAEEAARRSGHLWRCFRVQARLCSMALTAGHLEEASRWLERSEALLPAALLTPHTRCLDGDASSTAPSLPATSLDLRLIALANRGHFHLASGRAGDALPFLEEAARLRPLCVLQALEWDPQLLWAEALLLLGRSALAWEVLQQITQQTGGHPLCRFGQARFLGLCWRAALAQGNTAQAQVFLDSARGALERLSQNVTTLEERAALFQLPYHQILLSGVP